MIEPNEYGSFGDCVISCDICTAKPCENIKQALDELREYKQAEKDGRCVMLPCKSGDVVWEIQSDKTIQKWFVDRFQKNDGQAWCCIVKNVRNKWKYIDKCFMFSLFGKTVFLARKEAEAKLKEIKGE